MKISGVFSSQPRIVLFWKCIEYCGFLVFLLVVPRRMGVELFGQFALVTSLITFFTMIAGFGGMYLFGRVIPEYQGQGERSSVQALFVQVFCFRAMLGLILGFALILVLRVLLPSISLHSGLMAAGALVCGIVASACFQLFYGLNYFGWWLSREALVRYFFVVLLVLLPGWASLNNAMFAFFLAHAGFLILGAYWAWPYFAFEKSALSFSLLFSQLPNGLLVFASDLSLLAFWRVGEVLVSLLSRENSEVAYFHVACSVVFLVYFTLTQVTTMIVPSLTAIHLAGEGPRLASIAAFILRYITVIAVVVFLSTSIFGLHGINVLLGPDYRAVAHNLEILSFALVGMGVIRVGLCHAVVCKLPWHVFPAAMAGLGVFILGSILTIPMFDSFGASLSLVVAVVVSASLIGYRLSFGSVLRRARFWPILGLGLAVWFLLQAVPFSVPFAIQVVVIPLYCGLLWMLRFLQPQDLRQIADLLGSHPRDRLEFNQQAAQTSSQ